MNKSTASALLLDAFYQVLDDKIFRLLVILTIAMVAPTVLVGFQEEHISVLFGLKEYPYDTLVQFFGMRLSADAEPNVFIIQSLQTLVIEGLAGTLGIVFCIAATAFFSPRILEKGAADTTFSRPVSRLTLLLSRYFSGLLFVTILAVILIGGMHLGFLIFSGYSDPGFLWSVPTLIYLFSILHGFSVCVGVFTRSSTAAVLATLILFMFSGCIHKGWEAKEWSVNQDILETMRYDLGGRDDMPDISQDDDEPEVASGVLGFILTSLDVAHFILPKTGDADLITRKVRALVTEPTPVLEDEDAHLTITHHPSDFELVATAPTLEEPGLEWIHHDEDGRLVGTIRASRRSRLPDPDAAQADQQRRPKKVRAVDAAKQLHEEVTGLASTSGTPSQGREPVETLYTAYVSWTEERAGEEIRHIAHFFTFGNNIFRVEGEFASDWANQDHQDTRMLRFIGNFRFAGFGVQGSNAWYKDQFDWDAPLRYNIFFSIASSLAFCLTSLACAAWRLSRLDF
ncbi:MAG: ABC transporter permease subunit [Planctomycetota bacterium]|jgi:ABC-type transport system involved in multi-copper enzyme maturation permease subunit|nr:ABC transporter permease subunit [Planctomycetota bacterium]